MVPDRWGLPNRITLKMMLNHWFWVDRAAGVPPFKSLVTASVRHIKGEANQPGKMKRSMTKAVEIGRKAGVNMDGEVGVGKVGDLLDDVLEKYKPKKQQKGGRRKRELLWETSSGTTSHWRSGDHGWLGLMQYKVFHGTKLFVICVLL